MCFLGIHFQKRDKDIEPTILLLMKLKKKKNNIKNNSLSLGK